MDGPQFDRIVAALGQGMTRRGVVAVIGGLFAASLEEVVAKRAGHNRKERHQDRHQERREERRDDAKERKKAKKKACRPCKKRKQGKCKGKKPDGTACPGGNCVSGQCLPTAPGCTTPFSRCGEECVNLQTDPLHCGACDNACPLAESCVDGGCQCGALKEDIAPSTCCVPEPGHAEGICFNPGPYYSCATDDECDSGWSCCVGHCRPYRCSGTCLESDDECTGRAERCCWAYAEEQQIGLCVGTASCSHVIVNVPCDQCEDEGWGVCCGGVCFDLAACPSTSCAEDDECPLDQTCCSGYCVDARGNCPKGPEDEPLGEIGYAIGDTCEGIFGMVVACPEGYTPCEGRAERSCWACCPPESACDEALGVCRQTAAV
jgi:hypothetical protein